MGADNVVNEEFNPVLNKLTFKTISYNKNTNLIFRDDSFVTEYEGIITKLRIDEEKPPLHIGEFSMSQINVDIAKNFNADMNSFILKRVKEDCYVDLAWLVKGEKFNFDGYDKVLFIHNIIIRPDHRKLGITEEFVEYIYRTFYRKGIKIIFLVKPFQLKKDDFKYFIYEKIIDVRLRISDRSLQSFPARSYYALDDLLQTEDIELSEYKLFALASRCGLYRISDSYIFEFEPEKIIKRLRLKLNLINSGDLMIEDL
jgi:hypothetical protein